MATHVITPDEETETATIMTRLKYYRILNETEQLITRRKQKNDKRVLAAFYGCRKLVEEPSPLFS